MLADELNASIEMKFRTASYAQPHFVQQKIYLKLDFLFMCVFGTVVGDGNFSCGRFAFINFKHDFSLSDKFTLNKINYNTELILWFLFCLRVISLGTRTVPFLYVEESLNYAKCSYALNGYTPLTLLVVEEQLNFHSVSISMKLNHGPKKTLYSQYLVRVVTRRAYC